MLEAVLRTKKFLEFQDKSPRNPLHIPLVLTSAQGGLNHYE
ncbi:putative hypothetical protein [Helicobacter mustelae 12198]|uniref:Uncharacterized protein n=1 Tax=Helicobacter mustelae (strain ATCC 43772 / CCUG 25715 / CIP 103759 / LMG 18044 / NCTC 12198 / R85-136P) TaxID=679897 RepID=D3UHZ6_HELM1|nr:putative hypothetical protein [Helicobacter mustelae 12198]